MPHGETHVNAKLTEVAVNEIRRLYALADVTQSALAERFGISAGYITKLLAGKTWRNKR